VISGGVSAPLTAGLVEETGGGLVVVAQSVGDDGGGHLEQLLPDGGAAGGGGRDTGLAQERGQVVGAARLACPGAETACPLTLEPWDVRRFFARDP
jgi:hypothetical protein